MRARVRVADGWDPPFVLRGMQIENLDRAFETVKQKLFGRLHDILRKQIVERVPMQGTPARSSDAGPAPLFCPAGDQMKDVLTSFAVPLPPPTLDKEDVVPEAVEAKRLR